MTGYQKAKPKPLYEMFSAIPRRYDLINTVITWGLDKRWRLLAAKECLAGNPKRFLDIGCGTGDLAIDIAKLAGPGVAVIGADYSQEMLNIAAVKAARAGLKNITFTLGEVHCLPFPEGYFDAAGISFAFRNLTYKNPLAKNHFSEMYRILAPGGRLVIVETSQPESRLIRWFYHLYLRAYVGPVGRLLSGNPGAYNYLAGSAEKFYSAGEVKELLLETGFSRVKIRPLFFGATAIHTAFKQDNKC